MSSPVIRSTAPDAYILFFPYNQPITKMGEAYKESSMATTPLFVRTDLIACSTQKPKGGPGSWSCTLSPRVNYKSLIQPGCWCMIFMSDDDLTRSEKADFNNGINSGLKMLGIVRSVRAIEAIDPGSGVRSLRYEISGDDFHSVLDAQVYINPELRPHGDEKSNPVNDLLTYFKAAEMGARTPSEMLTLLTTTLLGQKEDIKTDILSSSGGKAGGVYGVPPNVAKRLTGRGASQNLFVNILNLAFQKECMGLVTFQPHLGSGFTLWSMVEQYANKVVNEVYTDLLPVKGKDGRTRLVPSMVLRCIPFTTKTFSPKFKGQTFKIPTLRIKANVKKDDYTHLYTSRFIGDDEIFAINYGKSDAERFNFFFVANNFANDHQLSAPSMGALLGNDKNTNSQNPLGDTNSVARNGLRPFFGGTIYAQIDENMFVAHNLVVRDLWHEAYLYENGQVQIVGTKEHIPVGTNIEFKDRDWIAHVEAVAHSYVVAPNGVKQFRTNISFVRLQKTDGTPIDFAKDAKDPKEFHPNITGSNGDKQ